MNKKLTIFIFILIFSLTPVFFVKAAEKWTVLQLTSSFVSFKVEIKGVVLNEKEVSFHVFNDIAHPQTIKYDDMIKTTINKNETSQDDNSYVVYGKFYKLAPGSHYVARFFQDTGSYISSRYQFETPSVVLSVNRASITDFTPKEGKVGDTITIKGENLNDTNTVIFNDTTTVPLADNKTSNQVLVKVPSGATDGFISIKTDTHGSNISTSKFVVTGAVASDNSSSKSSDSEKKSDLSSKGGGLVPDCPDSGCGFPELIKMVNTIIKFLLFTIATPLIALIIMYTGYLYLTAGGNSGQIEKVKHILFSAVIGYVVALSAWLIINTIVKTLNLDPNINTFMNKVEAVE